MHVDEIARNLAALNAAEAKPAKKAKAKLSNPPAPTAPVVNGHTAFNREEMLRLVTPRIVAALNLEAQGVTVDVIVAAVEQYEKPYTGTVQ